MELKQKLATLIDAYADAKRSGNDTLIQLATAQLQEFFSTIDLVPSTPPIVEEEGSKAE
jgi:hypothetical protein